MYGSSKSFINLDLNITAENKAFENRVDFWSNKVPAIINKPSLSSHIIQTKLGLINGSVTTSVKGKVFEFRNIPFAKPPVGNLRFRKSEAYGSWKGVLDATKFGPSCIQNVYFLNEFLTNKEISEDCLQLNIVVPNNISTTSNMSVMFYVYGGGFTSGQAQLYDARNLALRGNVIVVIPNYRLGIFGFLYSGDKSSPGNFGLWDQMLALQWVKDHIASFGGNPDSVTLFGESAGSFSVSLLSLIPRNRGLFHKCISQSGVAAAPGVTVKEPIEKYQQAANLGGCNKSTTNETVECLRQKTASEIFSLQGFGYNFAPAVDGDLIRKHPHEFLFGGPSDELSFFKSIPFIAGNTNREGSLFVDTVLDVLVGRDFNTSLGISTDIMCNKIVPDLAKRTYNTPNVKAAMCEKYSTNSSLADQANKALDLYGDINFIVPSVRQLEIPRTTASYQYLFHRPNPLYRRRKPWFTGAPHTSELNYLFDFQSPKSVKEERLADAMLQYWSNFAKTGLVGVYLFVGGCFLHSLLLMKYTINKFNGRQVIWLILS